MTTPQRDALEEMAGRLMEAMPKVDLLAPLAMQQFGLRFTCGVYVATKLLAIATQKVVKRENKKREKIKKLREKVMDELPIPATLLPSLYVGLLDPADLDKPQRAALVEMLATAESGWMSWDIEAILAIIFGETTELNNGLYMRITVQNQPGNAVL